MVKLLVRLSKLSQSEKIDILWRVSSELEEAIIYLGREEVNGPYSKELADAVNDRNCSLSI